LIYLLAWIPLVFIFIMLDGFPWLQRIALPALILGLSIIQVNLQFQMLGIEFHKPMQQAIQEIQIDRHRDVLNGTAPNPWQYRIFSEWIAEGFLNISAKLFGLNRAAFSALWSLRLLQNIVLLALAYLYFIRLGITKAISMYGVLLLSGGMLHVFHESDLSFNTYFDVIFYLLAAILILDEKYRWVAVLMFPAALNRETSAMIPILLIAWGWWKVSDNRAKAFGAGLIGMAVWAVTFTALHLYYPNAPLFKIGEGILPGWELFRYNLSVPKTAALLFQTLGFLPLVGVIAYRSWHLFVRICFLFLVPVWIVIHAFTSVWAETRLFLVLSALVFIPAVLPLIDQYLQKVRQGAWQPLSVSMQTLLESQR